jgi:hypothetical protein
MKPDIHILGQNKPTNQLLCTSLFDREILRIDANLKALHDRVKIHELRKSCGVEDKGTTINVRIPPRYRTER